MSVPSSLASMLAPDGFRVWKQPASRDDIVAGLVDRVLPMVPSLTEADILRRLHDRDALGDTYIGEGIDLPHARIEGISSPAFAVGRTDKGLLPSPTTPSAKETEVVWLLLLPPGAAGLAATAQVARACRDATFRQNLRAAKEDEELRHALVRWELSYAPPAGRWPG